MKSLSLAVLGTGLLISYATSGQEWKSECISYYQMQLPDSLEVGLYPVVGFVNPDERPEGNGFFITRRYAGNGITFSDKYNSAQADAVQAQFSSFYYDGYELDITSEDRSQINFSEYKKRVIDNINFRTEVIRKYKERDLRLLNKPMESKTEFNRKYSHILKDYQNAFVDYDYRGYTIYINSGRRLYHFWGRNEPDTGERTQTAEAQVEKSEPEVRSLLKRFRPRKLYEVPAEQGFCLPYGFIAGDSGDEPRNMGVTYRLKNHPDVTLFFQDLGMQPKAGKEDKLNEKDYVRWLWNWQYQWSAVSKEVIKPEWRAITMDGRKGVATFVKSVYKDGSVNYGYVAYVQGDRSARNKHPDLLFYAMQDSRQAKDNPPMDKDELEKMAERIVSSIKRR
jgi:hypothetical protein